MDDLDCQLEYWNRLGPGKSFHHPVNADRLAQWVSFDDPILDYGCGYGRVLGILDGLGYCRLIGVDPAKAMITEARRRLPGLRFEHCIDPCRLDLEKESIAAVLLFTVLTCVPTDEGHRAILREVGRVLRAGGLLYISDLWLQTDARNVERYKRDHHKYGTYGVFDLPEGVTVRHQDRQWLEELTAGYDVAVLEDVEIETMNGHRANGFQWFGAKR